MLNQEEILERVLTRVSEQVAASVRDTVMESVRRELSSAMTDTMVECGFFAQRPLVVFGATIINHKAVFLLKFSA